MGWDAPRAALERLKASGASIDIRFFPTATHAFDVPEALDARIRYNAEHTGQSQALLRALVSGASAGSSPAR